MSSNPSSDLKIEENPRGIPRAPFVQDVEKHIGGSDAEVESSIRQFQEAIAKYKYMETNLGQRRKGLEEKIPDIKKTLAMVELLRQRKGNAVDAPLTTTFELNDTLWAEATMDESDEVYLWLGANVMLSYPIDDAAGLLNIKLKSAQENLKAIISDLEFLREQITVMEVNTARVYNYDVRRRRERGLAAKP
ncbi:prefoldin subunit [Serendipita vermifera]|nr:prefoldin subunit [Serendipita vermifera]